MDRVVVATISFRLLYASVILHHEPWQSVSGYRDII
jgi:hypothetical protein